MAYLLPSDYIGLPYRDYYAHGYDEEGKMSEAIKCISCGGESYNEFGKTGLHCHLCYELIRQENTTLKKRVAELEHTLADSKRLDDMWAEKLANARKRVERMETIEALLSNLEYEHAELLGFLQKNSFDVEMEAKEKAEKRVEKAEADLPL